MKLLFALTSLATITLLSCGDDTPTGGTDTSSSATARSSGATLLSSGATPLSSGAIASSSSNASGQIVEDFVLADSSGSTWARGILHAGAVPSQLSATFLRDGNPSTEASLSLGTSLSHYPLVGGANLTNIPLSGEKSLEAKINWNDKTGCNGDYQMILTAVVNGATLVDTSEVYTQKYLNECQ